MPRKKNDKSELDSLIDSLNADDVQLPDIDREIERMNQKNPMDEVPDTDNAEKDCNGMMSAALKAFKEQARNEEKVFKDNTETEYWFCVCFQSREQKEVFLKAMAWFEHGDKYLDGQFVAKKLGVKLPEVNRKFNKGEVEKSMVNIGIIPAKKKK
ncbi:MAG TPA: hypothetical protein VFB72_05885 [Verrucomicrobiae bacterium]|nr:hypothetical protein [Verrucomicrobiae bacterium]